MAIYYLNLPLYARSLLRSRIKWLGGKHRAKSEAAATLLCRLGTPVGPLLIREATASGRRPQHRIAILDVLQRIGGPLGSDELYGLQYLIEHPDADVRQKAKQVIMAAGPCGLPGSPQAAARTQAFNPLLASPPRRRAPSKRLKDFRATLRGDLDAARRRAKSSAAWEKHEEREQAKARDS